MKNYQALHYRHYYLLQPNGESVECSRQECFAPGEQPTPDNPFIQRWYYSPDQEMAVRLQRNEAGSDTRRANAADQKMQERWEQRARLRGCLEIDKPMQRTDDGAASEFDIEDLALHPDEIHENKELHAAILFAVKALTPEEQLLWDALLKGKTKAKIADQCGVSEGAIRKRVKKLAQALIEDPTLKNYFLEK